LINPVNSQTDRQTQTHNLLGRSNNNLH